MFSIKTIKQDHIWQGLLILAYLFLTYNFFEQRFGFAYGSMKAILLVSFQVFIWQFNLHYLVPKLLLEKKHVIYALSLFSFVLIIAFLYQYIEKEIFQAWKQSNSERMMFPFDDPEMREKALKNRNAKRVRKGFRIFESTYNIILFGVIALASTAYRMTLFGLKKENEATLLREEQVKSEMSFLKSQVNPHFLFNVLNNIYTLSFIKSEKTPEVVLQLSDMLRYMLYDTSTETVPIHKEVDYLKNFIDLHLLKSDSIKDNIETHWNIEKPSLQIAPLLFAPFIENAFKHSHIEDEDHGWIKVKLDVTTKNEIYFEAANSKPKTKLSKDQLGGIGLENVKKRLNLQYNLKHQLEIIDTQDSFTVKLKIHT
ncbi:sensor histidine kinase [Flammeovirga sp. OC4]|uniref:sensor histidine kinase n=1 Tax=Flammeovirga sp. OC4 TaxID=1382345 RepID=UPI00069458A3|nr:sensor histidine kinase [Flammeovirga sp. OC4]